MSHPLNLLFHKVKVILTYLKQGHFLLLLKKIYLNRQKRQRLLSTMGSKIKPANFSHEIDPSLHNVIIIDHYLGGGANYYREQKLNSILDTNKAVILLLNDPLSSYFLLCYIHPSKRFYIEVKKFEYCLSLCEKTIIDEILLNNCVSYLNAESIPLLLTNYKQKTNTKLSLFLHDYFYICPSYNLLNYKDQFCNIPDLQTCRNCLNQHSGDFAQLLPKIDIDVWRKNWKMCLQEADHIYAFSISSKILLLKAYPNLPTDKIQIQPHKVDYIHYRPKIKKQNKLHIAIIGNINRKEKGYNLVIEMIMLMGKQNLDLNITIIGSLDEAPKLKNLTITGAYQRHHLPELIEKIGANICFFPSIVPETFSYTCEEIMQMDLPLAIFNLGAPVERVQNYSKGIIINDISAQAALNQLLEHHKYI